MTTSPADEQPSAKRLDQIRSRVGSGVSDAATRVQGARESLQGSGPAATLAYKPNSRTGFTCELQLGEAIVLTAAMQPDAAEPSVDGDEAYRTNAALVDLVVGYSTDENLARRTRKPGETERLTDQADELREEAEYLTELIASLGDENESGWCSSCFTESTHQASVVHRLRVDAFVCNSCGTATKRCSVARCGNFAVRSGRRFAIKSCAEHSHAIPSFERSNERVATFADVGDWLAFSKRNVRRDLLKAGSFVGAAAVTAPFAVLAAPAVGGLIGAWGTGLSGAAASSHGLAMLGLGTVASGGFGMAGGTVVVAAVGSSLLGAKGVAVASAYSSDDPSFAFELLRDGAGPTVIFATGFLTESAEPWEQWQPMIDARFPGHRVYRLQWGAKELGDLAKFAGQAAGVEVAKKGAAKLASRATKLAAKRIGSVAAINSAADAARNPWHVARRRAQMTGAALASIIGHVGETPVVLVGHSLGGLVIASAAEALGFDRLDPRIAEMHLLGAAVNADRDLSRISAATEGTVFNYWSSNDQVLARSYRAAQFNDRAAGGTGFTMTRPGVKNVNVSRNVNGHSAYVTEVKLRSS